MYITIHSKPEIMSKQEILSWCSLSTSLSIVFFYLLIVFGWPDTLPDYSGTLTKVFFNVFWIALVVEIILEVNEKKKEVDKDERDFMIEAKGLQHAYGFLSFAIAFILVDILLNNLFTGLLSLSPVTEDTNTAFHSLFLVLFSSNIIKRVTQIYHYRKTI